MRTSSAGERRIRRLVARVLLASLSLQWGAGNWLVEARPAASNAVSDSGNALTPSIASGASSDLRNWVPYGAWTVDSDGTGAGIEASTASFLSTPSEHLGVELEATLDTRLATGSGRVGLVLGMRAPWPPYRADHELLVFGGSLLEGAGSGTFSLARVTGDPAGDTAFSADEPTAGATLLARQQGVGSGFAQGLHQIRARHRAGRIEVAVDGSVVLEALGSFPAGHVGLFAVGASGVRFSDVRLSEPDTPPTAAAGADRVVLAAATCAAEVALDGSASTDPDGDALSYSWSGPFGSAEGARPSVSLPVGVHSVQLVVEDGTGRSAQDEVRVSVVDGVNPALECPAPVRLTTDPDTCQATVPDLGTPVASDACGIASLVHDAPTSLPLGRSSIVWTAADPAGYSSTCSQDVTVVDAQRPSVGITTAIPQLWPANHVLVDVGLDVFAGDNCGGALTQQIAVWSDEPDEDQTGDGNAPGDAVIEPGRLQLRSERKGNGDGRVYLLILRATDAAGNAGVACGTVTVPKSQSAAAKSQVVAQAQAALGTCQGSGTAPSGFVLVGEGYLARPNQPPLVDAGTDQEITLPIRTVNLAGSATDDGLPGGAVGVSWDVVSAPSCVGSGGCGEVSFGDRTAANTSVTLPAPGVYVLRLTAFDGEKAGSDDVTVTLNAANQAPVVDAGPDLETRLPAGATLTGTIGDDGLPSGSSLIIQWSVASAPGGAQVTFANATSAATTASFDTAGDYSLRLTVSDTDLSASDEVMVRVLPENRPPVVSAGPDVRLELPANSTTLLGAASDDGAPSGTLEVSWSVTTSPAGGSVSLADASAQATTATFDGIGLYRLRLTASDGSLSAYDEVEVTLAPPPLPALELVDAEVTEGHDGVREFELTARLDAVAAHPVSVDYFTLGASAANACAGISSFGTVSFAVGETEKTYRVRFRGDLLSEPDETVEVHFGAPQGVRLPDAVALLTVRDDDGPNQPPSRPRDPLPADRSTGGPLAQTLGWSSGDPDAGDAALYDVHFGTSWSANGQSFAPLCAPGPRPAPRHGAAFAYDDANDRLMIFGGADGAGTALADVWVLANASGEGAAPSWQALLPAGASPGARRNATASFDPSTNRLIVHGGCDDGCGTSTGETWVLTHANGLGGPSEWLPLPTAPQARADHAAGYSPTANRLVVFGGRDGAADHGDLLALVDANGLGSPRWELVSPAGVAPSARHAAAFTYDAEHDRLYLLGGRDVADAASGDLLVLSQATSGAPEWSELPIGGDQGPVARSSASLGFEPASGRLLLFGGTTAGLDSGTNFVFGDAWLLEGATPDAAFRAWIPIEVDDPARPAPRFAAAGAYSPTRNRLVIASGFSNKGTPTAYEDAWALRNAAGTLPLLATAQSATTFDPGVLVDGVTYFWRIVARDGHGATASSPTWRFAPAANRAPSVQAGADLFASMPDASVILSASVNDDALPPAAPVTLLWSVVSAPAGATVSFADATAATTGATFDAAGTFTLQLTASDGELSASDEIVVTVDPANAGPIVDAGPDQSFTHPTTLVVNGGAEAGTTGWLAAAGGWNTVPFLSYTPPAPEGTRYFWASGNSELYQDVSLSADAAAIDASTGHYQLQALFRASTAYNCEGRLVVEYRDATGTQVLASDDTGYIRSPGAWRLLSRGSFAPPGSRTARIRLFARTAAVGSPLDVFFDAISLRPFPQPVRFSLAGSVGDDGLPRGGALTPQWNAVSGPGAGSLTFASPGSPTTEASIAVPGSHVVRLTASDGALSASDDATLVVNATNLPPAVDAGADQTLLVGDQLPFGVNLLRNAGNDLPLVGSEIPFWREVAGTDWRKAPTTTPYPAPFDGASYFYAGGGTTIAELRQDTDVSAFAATIDAGEQPFVFRGRVRTLGTDASRVVVQYRDEAGVPLDAFDSGDILSESEWRLVEDERLAPAGTRQIRVRLIASIEAGDSVDGFFDALQLHAPVRHEAALLGTIADEGLPEGSASSHEWSVASIPAGARAELAQPGELGTAVSLGDRAGTYTLLLTASDGALSNSDDVRLTLDPGNQPPFVELGVDRILASTGASLALSPAVVDDGRPSSMLTYSWTMSNGPGSVTFSPSATVLNATLRFSAAGVYRIRFSASDGEKAGFGELNVSVNGTNQAPLVDAGPDQVLQTYTAALAADVTDDGLPPPALLALTWASLSGPGVVSFSDPYSASTTATFSAAGTYQLRLSASDSALTAADEVTIVVAPETALADLALSLLSSAQVAYEAQTLALSGSLLLRVTNGGAGDAPSSTLTVFEDLDADGSFGPADAVLGTAIVPALAGGASADLEVSLSGAITFPGTHLIALADSAGAVLELSEANNVASTAPGCQQRTEFAPFSPTLEWAWTASNVAPEDTGVSAMPAVADVDADGVPDVVFSSFATGESASAFLRAVSGGDGRELWTVADETLRLDGSAAPAIGDIDGDGLPDIVNVAAGRRRILAFERDGTLKWASATIEAPTAGQTLHSQNLSLADLDGDGLIEIVAGRQVLNSDGTLRWTGAGGRSGQAVAVYQTASLVADLDLDGVPEVFAGNTAYRANGSIYWERSGLVAGGLPTIPDGYAAVGNFDSDPFPEIVTIGGAEVRLLEHDGALKWGPVLLPAIPSNAERGGGGPPLVADVDDDGAPEIGIAGATAYTMFEGDGTVKWSRPVQDLSSSRTGSSAFDLEGDGSSEVLYADEVKLRIYRGSDGFLLFETPMGSGTGLEYPVVADVDADGRAEIVAIANKYQQTERAGIYVFGDAADQWVPTRRLWNQHAYHVTNVTDEGRIPRREQPSWQTYNSYRQNHLIDGCVFAQADLLPAYVRKSADAGGTRVTARIGNKGGSLAGPGIPVSFYSGDPRTGGAFLGSVSTITPLAPASYEDVTLTVPSGTAALPVFVWADDDGAGHGVRAESDEANNVYESPVYITATPNLAPVVDAGPDLWVESPAASASLAGSATDDGQPVGELLYNWGVVSAPEGGRVSFGASSNASTSATFEGAGVYVLRLSAFDRDLSGSDEISVTATLPNQSPIVNAGPDRRLYAPETERTLVGSVADDGLPLPFAPVIEWSVVSTPPGGTVTFVATPACSVDTPDHAVCTCPTVPPVSGVATCAASPSIQASFSGLGRYVLRLTANDGRITVSDEVAVDSLPARSNAAPVVAAGADQAVALGTNLVVNGGGEDGLAGWTQGVGTWTTAVDDVIEGERRFASLGGNFSLRQDVPAAAFVGRKLDLEVWHRTAALPNTAGAVVVAELWSATGEPLGAFATPDAIYSPTWAVVRASLVPPPGTAYVRLVLVAGGVGGAGVHFDGVSLRVAGAAVDLAGTATDDGLPAPPFLQAQWTVASAPAGEQVSFGSCSSEGAGTAAGVPAACTCTTTDGGLDGDAAAVACATQAGLTSGGAYAFRLSGNDGELSALDEVLVNVSAPNARPVVEAGPNLTVTLPTNEVALAGSTSDPDGGPGPLAVRWEQLSGPGPLAFEDRASPTTRVRATRAGTYSLRLRASDSDRFAFDQMTLVVDSAGGENQPPYVNPGPALVATLPDDTAVLAGLVEDDGLPEGQPLSIEWTQLEGPGPVAFADASNPQTAAMFGASGAYTLRLTASDGEFTVSADVPVSVLAEGTDNAAPLVDAGADQILNGPGAMAALTAVVTDDGKPAGEALALSWSVLQAPLGGGVAFGSPAASTTTATFSGVGSYLLRLTADDGQIRATDDVAVRVYPLNQAPVVDAGPDQQIVLPPQVTVTLPGVVSDDGLPLGSSVTANWSVVSVTGTGSGTCAPPCGTVAFGDPTNPATSATFNRRGTYVLRLEASDGTLAASDDVVVVVAPGPNQPPAVSAGPDQALTLPANAISVLGGATDEGLPETSALTLSWSVLSGPSLGRATFATTVSCTATPDGQGCACAEPAACAAGAAFDAPGTYLLRLTASDGELAAADDVVIVVEGTPASGEAPSADLLTPADGAAVTAPTPVTGVVTGDAVSWRLEHRPSGDTGGWTPFAAGSGAASGALGDLDPTLLLNGALDLRLVAVDAAGRSSIDQVAVVIRENLKVGQFTVSFADLEVPVSGLPIRVTRSYDSRDKTRGDFGVGWRVDISNVRVRESQTQGLAFVGTVIPGFFPTYCIQAARPPIVTLTLPDGRVEEYEAEISPQCQQFAPIQTARITYRKRGPTLSSLSVVGTDEVSITGIWPGPLQVFSHEDYRLLSPARYRLALVDGRELVVGRAAGLERLRDLNANELTVGPGGITHVSGRGVTFTRDPQGRITRITDPEGAFLAYTYDLAGDLVAVTDREGHTTRFTYLAQIPHHLEAIEDPLGRQPIRNEYGPDGRLAKHTDAFGKTIEYTHSLAARQEIVQDRNGHQRVLEYDERGNVVKEAQPDGRQILRGFDARNNRTSETEPHDPSDPTPPSMSFVYDARDNLLKTTDALGQTTEYTSDSQGRVLTTKDARGLFTVNAYDAKGNLLSTKSGGASVAGPFVSEATYTYDARGNLKTQTTIVAGAAQTASYDYDAFGNLTKETDALGHETASTYDRNGNRLSQSTTRTQRVCSPGPAGSFTCTSSAPETLTTTYEHDRQGRLVKASDPDNTFTRTVYDALGRQAETFDKLGRKTSFEYDEMGRLVKTTFADSTSESSTYDPEGRRLTSKDRAGRTTAYQYDALGRLTKTTFPDTTFTEQIYDAAGRLEASRDARGKATLYGYDAAGRRTKVRDPLGNETVFTYDPNGNQKTVRDARLQTTTYEYDELNRRTKTSFPDGTFAETGYDELGRRTSEKDQAGKVTRFEYDALGRLTAVGDALEQRTEYEYDEVGNRLVQRDANGHETRFEYDALGRETARLLPDASRESKTYDAAGNLATRTDFLGRTTTYSYDPTNRLTSRLYPNAAENVSFTYTATGRRLTATDARGTTSYGYDLRDRLTSLVQPGVGSLAYGYDGNGNRTSLTATIAAQSHATGYGYDDAGRLDVVTDPAGRTYDFEHDPNGNRASLAYPNGTSTTYTYDALNRLTNLATTGPLGTVQGYAFTLGPAGNRTRIDEADGTIREYGYDALYRLTSETVRDSVATLYSKSFSYDPVGNRQQQVTASAGGAGLPAPGTVDYAYDTRDRLLAENANASTYDPNGNLTAKVGEATYTWDHENRLIAVAKADGTTVRYAYDVDGNRVSTTTTPAGGSATTTAYLVDTSGGLSHVVADVDATTPATPTLSAVYVRGSDDLLSVLRPLVPAPASPADWQTRYYHADGIGSIRRLTDETGTITDGYTYTAFGERVSHTGTDPQAYAFAGEPLDPISDLQYHRARWMDPKGGRFVGVDGFPGLEAEPSSLHRYLYASLNPAGSVDPSGLTNLVQLSAATGLIVNLAARATPALFAGQRLIYYTLMRGPEIIGRLDAYLTIVSGGAATVELAARWTSIALTTTFPYSSGPAPRGFEFGDVLGQNLTDVNEGLDHWEFGGNGRKDVAAQIFSTTQTDSPEQLLRAIEQKALRLSALNQSGERELHFNSGRVLPVTGAQMRVAEKLLFVGIPDDALAWNPQPFLGSLQTMMRRLRVGIAVVPASGLRKPR